MWLKVKLLTAVDQAELMKALENGANWNRSKKKKKNSAPKIDGRWRSGERNVFQLRRPFSGGRGPEFSISAAGADAAISARTRTAPVVRRVDSGDSKNNTEPRRSVSMQHNVYLCKSTPCGQIGCCNGSSSAECATSLSPSPRHRNEFVFGSVCAYFYRTAFFFLCSSFRILFDRSGFAHIDANLIVYTAHPNSRATKDFDAPDNERVAATSNLSTVVRGKKKGATEIRRSNPLETTETIDRKKWQKNPFLFFFYLLETELLSGTIEFSSIELENVVCWKQWSNG